jgi:fatty-acyl-CoA synthase
VTSLAWNTHRHLELFFAVPGMGAVLHTANPRLFDDQIVYIVNHAADRLLFVDDSFLPLIERLAPRLPAACGIVAMGEAETAFPLVARQDALIDGESADFAWPEFDERTASSLCYTSGTTGRPKGALYSHRSTVLHAFALSLPDATAISAQETVAPVVPMFHANAWGTVYAAPMNGAKLVLPGPHLDGASLHRLFEDEGVTLGYGVPTVWLGFEAHLAATGAACTTLARVLCGGSAVAPSLIEAFDRRGIAIVQGWGMTEMSPLGSTSALKAKHRALDPAARLAVRATQGRPIFGVEMAIVGDDGARLPHDGTAVGEVVVRGQWVVSGYFEDEEATRAAFTADGWFRTGDVAAIDADGFMAIADRRKDIIKSGGEWISSIDLENAAMAHGDVAEAAVIAVPHPKWGERPLLVVVPRPGRPIVGADLIAFLGRRFPRWMLPDEVATLAELPHTATGKIMKTRLRAMFAERKPRDC